MCVCYVCITDIGFWVRVRYVVGMGMLSFVTHLGFERLLIVMFLSFALLDRGRLCGIGLLSHPSGLGLSIGIGTMSSINLFERLLVIDVSSFCPCRILPALAFAAS